jgi:TM2 domain-containing membrane protein YozV
MRYFLVLLILFTTSLSVAPSYAAPIEPASREKQEKPIVKKQKKGFRWKLKKQRPKALKKRSSILTFLFFLMPIVGVVLFIIGALGANLGLWLSGLLGWGLIVLVLSILFFWIAVELLNYKDERRSGLGGVFLALLWLYTLVLSFLLGLIPLIWGLIAELMLLWVVGAAFSGFGLLLFIIGLLIFQQL